MAASRIAVCSWSLQPADPADLLQQVQVAGLDAVQLDLSRLAADPKDWYPAMQLLPEAGIDIISGMMAMKGEDYSTLETIARTGGVRPDETWPPNLTRAEMVIEIAKEIGLELVTFHAGFIPEEVADPERDKLLERLRELADMFGAANLRLGLETGQETADTLAEALNDLDRPNVGVNFDPANMILYGKGEPVEALRLLADRVVQIHVKDALPTELPGTWGAEVPVGSGAVDWPAFFEIARAIKPPVNFVIEREAGDDRVADITWAYDQVAQHLGGA